MNHIDTEIATDLITTARTNDELVLITLVGGTTVSGAPISVNSKGVNLKVDGKTRSFGLRRIDAIDLVAVDDDSDEDEELSADAEIEDADMEMEDILNQISDGASTAEIAAHLTDYLRREITPKELRVHLRALGLGVGKGRKYALSAGEFRAVVGVINAEPIAA